MGFLYGPTDTFAVVDRYPSFSGELAFDIGANAGWFAAKLSEQFTTVLACEPYVPSYRRMVQTAPQGVWPLNVAVSDHAGTVELQACAVTEKWGELFSVNDIALPDWGGVIDTVTVESVTLDDLAAKYGQPDFVKIDTEGHECRVLAGGEQTFEAGPEFLIEIHARRYGDWVVDYLDRLGLAYEAIHHEPYGEGSHDWHSHFWLLSPP